MVCCTYHVARGWPWLGCRGVRGVIGRGSVNSNECGVRCAGVGACCGCSDRDILSSGVVLCVCVCGGGYMLTELEL